MHGGDAGATAADGGGSGGGEAAASSSTVSRTATRLADELASRVPSRFAQLGQLVRSGALDGYVQAPDRPPANVLPPTDDVVADRFAELLLLKVLRPDRLPAAMAAYVAAVFDAEFLQPGEADLAGAVARTGANRTPILMTAAPGYDSGAQVSCAGLHMPPSPVDLLVVHRCRRWRPTCSDPVFRWPSALRKVLASRKR